MPNDQEVLLRALEERLRTGTPTGISRPTSQRAGRAGGAKGFALDILPFGRVGEKLINPGAGDITGGELALEAALTAIPFGLGKLGKGAKVAGAVGKAAKSSSRFGRIGESLSGTARGITPGRVAGGVKLKSPKQARELNRFLTKEVKTKAASSPRQLEDVERFINTESRKLNRLLSKRNRLLTDDEKLTIASRLNSRFSKEVVSATPRQTKVLNDTLDRILETKDLKGLDNLRKQLDDSINFARTSDKLIESEQAFSIGRRELTKVLGKKVKASKDLKSRLNKAFTAQEFLFTQAGRRGSGASPAGITLPGRLAQGTQARVGRGLERVGSITGSPAFRQGARQAGVRVGADALGIRGEPELPPTPEELVNIDVGGGMEGELPTLDTFGQEPPELTPQGPQFTQENYAAALMADLQQTGGKNTTAITKIFEALNPEGGLSAKEREAQAKKENLTRSIALLGQNFEAAGGGQGAGGILSSILGRTPGVRSAGLDKKAQVFEDKRKALIAPLARAISGEVGVLTDRDISRAEGLLPRLSDPEEVARQKLSELVFLIQQTGAASGEEDITGIPIEELLLQGGGI